jgi:hypothetical protein
MFKMLDGYTGQVVEELNNLRKTHEVEVIETRFDGAKYMRCLVKLVEFKNATKVVAPKATPKKAPAVKA